MCVCVGVGWGGGGVVNPNGFDMFAQGAPDAQRRNNSWGHGASDGCVCVRVCVCVCVFLCVFVWHQEAPAVTLQMHHYHTTTTTPPTPPDTRRPRQ